METKYIVQSRGHSGVWRDSYTWNTEAEAREDVRALLEKIGTAAGEMRVVKRTEEVLAEQS